jgi:polysaccharide pyruvyl transferase WcaK-like protein
MNVLLYGYYDMGNFGDDIFEYIFTKYLTSKSFNCTIANPVKLNLKNTKRTKITKIENSLYKSGSFVLNKEIVFQQNM